MYCHVPRHRIELVIRMKKYLLLTLTVTIAQNSYAEEPKNKKADVNISKVEMSSDDPINVPPFFGIIFRKNERTEKFIHNTSRYLLWSEPNENKDLIAFPVAMNISDLEEEIKKLTEKGLVYRTDFVATSSFDGVIDIPEWLTVEERKERPDKKFYSLAPGH